MFCPNCGNQMTEDTAFCIHCGAPVQAAPRQPMFQQPFFQNGQPALNADAAKGFMESMKNRMGIGDPELNQGDAFEKDKLIVPDCVSANEGEVPVKQYKVATLRNRILGITYTKAVGRMQVTNKRVIFRAPGRCLAGRTTLQHEFAIDELAGVEARREYVFNAADLIIGMICTLLGGFLINWLIGAMCESSLKDGVFLLGLMTLVFGVAGCIPFFMIKKKWLLKLLCLGGSFMPLLTQSSVVSMFGKADDSAITEFFGTILLILGVISLIFALITLFIYSIKPNLVLCIKVKSATDAIDIKRKKLAVFGGKEEEHTGYAEVIPEEDAERCIREINAMINDIQKLGDFGIDKWKQ